MKRKDRTVQTVCNHAAEVYSSLLILGETKEGHYQMISSFTDERNILWHMEFAKYHFLKNGFNTE